jgi:hypothetical protein
MFRLERHKQKRAQPCDLASTYVEVLSFEYTTCTYVLPLFYVNSSSESTKIRFKSTLIIISYKKTP